jgi:hypothetical protein
MVRAQQVVLPQLCPRCTGLMYHEDDEACCLYCGERVFRTRLLMSPPLAVIPDHGEPRKRGRPRKLPVPLDSPPTPLS